MTRRMKVFLVLLVLILSAGYLIVQSNPGLGEAIKGLFQGGTNKVTEGVKQAATNIAPSPSPTPCPGGDCPPTPTPRPTNTPVPPTVTPTQTATMTPTATVTPTPLVKIGVCSYEYVLAGQRENNLEYTEYNGSVEPIVISAEIDGNCDNIESLTMELPLSVYQVLRNGSQVQGFELAYRMSGVPQKKLPRVATNAPTSTLNAPNGTPMPTAGVQILPGGKQ